MPGKKGVIGAGYIDDLYWAATFNRLVEVISFVIERGPAYGYNLSLKKSIYLMAPSSKRLSADELDRRIHVLNVLVLVLGAPTQSVKVHPDCQSGAPSALVAKRKAEWGFKILGAYVGTDEFVMNALQQKMESIRKITQTLLLYPNVQAR